MILSVDTKHDSHDDIRKVIAMLQHLVGDKELVSNASLSSSPQPAEALATIFDLPLADASSPSAIIPGASHQTEAKKTDADLFSDLFTIDDVAEAKKESEEDEEEAAARKPRVEFY